MLWISLTVAAAALQVARNAAQRSLVGGAGPWGATLVRFLFGLPFSTALAAAIWMVASPTDLQPTWAYLGLAMAGALAQLLATAALLVSMRRAGFAVGSALQQSSLPFAALVGWLMFGDVLGDWAWVGVVTATAGLSVLTWPRGATGERPLSGGLYGLLSGALFGASVNAFRHAALTLAPGEPAFSAVATVVLAQACQSLALGAILAWRRPGALRALAAGWRESLVAGACGAFASAAWLFALALAPAASVRAVGVIEAPIAAAVGRRLFAERIPLSRLAAGALVAAGVVLTALG